MRGTAYAIANNDIVHIAWSFESLIRDCAGFVIYRQPADESAGWVKAGGAVAQADRVDVKRFYDIDWNPAAPREDWQTRYFDESRLAMREREFWIGTGLRLKALQPPPGSRRAFGYTPAERALAAARKQLKEQKKATKTASAKGAASVPRKRAKAKRVSKGKTRR